jgi:hypothetical protein
MISGYVTNGLSRFIEYFKAFVIPAFSADAMAVTHAFLTNSLSFLINPVTAIPAGIPATTKASEFDTNLKKLSDGNAAGELIDLSILISIFWECRLLHENININISNRCLIFSYPVSVKFFGPASILI